MDFRKHLNDSDLNGQVAIQVSTFLSLLNKVEKEDKAEAVAPDPGYMREIAEKVTITPVEKEDVPVTEPDTEEPKADEDIVFRPYTGPQDRLNELYQITGFDVTPLKENLPVSYPNMVRALKNMKATQKTIDSLDVIGITNPGILYEGITITVDDLLRNLKGEMLEMALAAYGREYTVTDNSDKDSNVTDNNDEDPAVTDKGDEDTELVPEKEPEKEIPAEEKSSTEPSGNGHDDDDILNSTESEDIDLDKTVDSILNSDDDLDNDISSILGD